MGLGGGTGELGDVAAVKKPFMNSTSLSVVYPAKYSAYMRGGKKTVRTLRLLGGRRAVALREKLGIGKKYVSG